MGQLAKIGLGRPRAPFYGWAVVAVAMLATFCSGPGQSFVFSVFVDPIIADIGLSRMQVSGLYALGTAVSAAMVVLVGRMVNRFGARLMLALVALALGVACFGMSFAAEPIAIFLGFAALRALGQGSLPITATVLTAQWFVKRRGRAVAVVMLGIAAANAVMPPATQLFIGAFGWREAYMALGAMVWVLLIPAAILVVRDRPEAVGLLPDAKEAPGEPAEAGGESRGSDVNSADSGGEEPSDNASEGETGRRGVLLSPQFWLLALPIAAAPFVVTALVFHQISVLGNQGLDPASAAGAFAAFAVAAAAATMFGGPLVERLGPIKPLVASLGILPVALLELATTVLAAAVYAALLGLAQGLQSIVNGTAWAHFYGREGLGSVQGPATMVSISAAALAPLPLAALQQSTGGYTTGLVLMGVVPVVCMLMLAAFRPERARAQAR
jgi:sugar phosphate permease